LVFPDAPKCGPPSGSQSTKKELGIVFEKAHT
jgi:hypothetical protein